MFLHAKHAAIGGSKSINIVSSDTDVVVIVGAEAMEYFFCILKHIPGLSCCLFTFSNKCRHGITTCECMKEG
jgi:hypothetical protein